jgi:hypothetical protein
VALVGGGMFFAEAKLMVRERLVYVCVNAEALKEELFEYFGQQG